MRLGLIVALIIASFITLHAEEALPATAPSTFDLDSLGVDSRLLPGVPALTQYQNDVAKAKSAYEAAIYKAAEELRKKLQQAQDQATKSGDLDKALAIRGAMDKLPKAPKATRPAPVDFKAAAVGTWQMTVANGWQSPLILTEKGAASVKDNKGAFHVTAEGVLSLSWNNGRIETITLAADGTHGEGSSAEGFAVTITKKQ